MSTFKGRVREFPDIRVDYFRPSLDDVRPSLANFLSHVHSDHLLGLESCKAPFIYCSAATREILLRLEKYPHRMNFAKGILETRKQTYKHLKRLLKPIPLETPTEIELSPGNNVRVTLFDANHCIGAVMFLIEGHNRRILYTGDIRSETWWVDALTRHPLLIPYVIPTQGERLNRLDCIYLDTTFATKSDPYRTFPSKAEGITELLHAVSKYPKGTAFYFDSWTFGYEDVWLALSSFLNSQIHLDDYRYTLYRAVATHAEFKNPDVARLIGFQCGNHTQQGCLTPLQAQLHSCEKGTGCDIFESEYVRITPIISRYGGAEIAELGAGGGTGDLNQQHELEVGDQQLIGQLMALCTSKLAGQPQALKDVLEMLIRFIEENVQRIKLEPSKLTQNDNRNAIEELTELDSLPLDRLIPALLDFVARSKQIKRHENNDVQALARNDAANHEQLPKRLTFPYSRHSSYKELCYLIAAFQPKEIHPCTVDELGWSSDRSMSHLFGHLYPQSPTFAHDQEMYAKITVANPVQMTLPPSSPTYEPPSGSLGDGPKDENGEPLDAHQDAIAISTADGSKHKDYPIKRLKLQEAVTRDEREAENSTEDGRYIKSSERRRSTQPSEKSSRERSEHRHTFPGPSVSRRHSPRRSIGESAKQKPVTEGKATTSQDGSESDEDPVEVIRRRIAHRREVYNALAAGDLSQWYAVGLVSVNGHQQPEEEL